MKHFTLHYVFVDMCFYMHLFEHGAFVASPCSSLEAVQICKAANEISQLNKVKSKWMSDAANSQ